MIIADQAFATWRLATLGDEAEQRTKSTPT